MIGAVELTQAVALLGFPVKLQWDAAGQRGAAGLHPPHPLAEDGAEDGNS